MNPNTQSVGVGTRLKHTLEARGQSIRDFASELEAAGAENSAYSSVFRYVKGEVEPSLSWTVAAAKVLEVSPGWLAFEEGPRDARRDPEEDLDVRVARAVGPGRGSTDTRKEILRGLQAGVGAEVPEAWLTTLEAVFWRRWTGPARDLPAQALAEAIGRAALAPLAELGIDPGQLERYEIERWIPYMYAPLMELAGVFTEDTDE